jgi:drug/metabolite transporter (DMT)-like permease
MWMILSALLFAAMGVCVKIASDWFSSMELVFYRGLIGVIFVWLIARHGGVKLATRYPGMHAWRSCVGVASIGTWFYALAHLPLATAMTLNYMSSIWIAFFLVGSALLAWVPVPGRDGRARRRPLQGSMFLTVLAGFAGVVMMLQPSAADSKSFAGLVGLFSGLVAALAYMQVIALSRLGEPETRTVFYFAVGSAIAGGLGLWVAPSASSNQWTWGHAVWLLPVGVFAALGQLCMTHAYAKVKTRNGALTIANLQYSGIVFAAIFSLLLFDEHIDALGWAGMALIVASGIAATVLRQRSLPATPAEDH